MRVIIAGSRSIIRLATVTYAIELSEFEITTVVSGCCRGVDQLGCAWARANNIPVAFYPAWADQEQWAKANIKPGEYLHPLPPYSRGAGFLRNEVMSRAADGLVSVWDGKSRGTADMIWRAEARKLKISTYTDN